MNKKNRLRKIYRVLFLSLCICIMTTASVLSSFAYDTMIPATSLAGVLYQNTFVRSDHPFDLAAGKQYGGIISNKIIVPTSASWDYEYTDNGHIIVSVQYNFTCKEAGYANLSVAVDGLDVGAVLSASFLDTGGWSSAAVNLSANRQTLSDYTVYGDPYHTGLGFESVHFDTAQDVITFGQITLQQNYDYSIILRITTSYSTPNIFWGWQIPADVSNFFGDIYALPWVSYLFTIFVSFALFGIFMQFMR